MASRDINDLTPVCREKYLEFSLEMAKAGLHHAVTCTLRKAMEQLALHAQGRKCLEDVNLLRRGCGMVPITEAENKHCVTWTVNSRHFAGPDGKSRAFDIVILDKARKSTYDLKADVDEDQIPDYTEAGEIGKEVGLVWGGDFRDKSGKPCPDMVHFQLARTA